MIPGFNLTYSIENGKILPFGTQKPMQDSAAGVQNFIRKELMHVRLLFVDCCPRGGASRTLRLCRAFLDEAGQALRGLETETEALTAGSLLPLDADRLAERERRCDARDWRDPMFRAARALQRADAVLIGAPYWDLSFPSMLKVWVENVYVRNLTFRYEADRCSGLCTGKAVVYLTTAGSPIGENDWGAGYIHAVLDSLGIHGFVRYAAEGLDLADADPAAIMDRAEAEVRCLAKQWSAQWKEN